MVTATALASNTMLVWISHGEHDMQPGAGPVHKGTDLELNMEHDAI